MDDFGDLGSKSSSKGAGKRMREDDDKGQARILLKVFETLPPQLLNAYGEAKYGKLPDADVWKHLCKPLKSGAMYCTEFCSVSEERRGVATNRWLQTIIAYCQYQNEDKVKKQNEAILKPENYRELYEEIDSILPSFEYCIAPKKVSEKAGAASLRSSAGGTATYQAKDPAELDKHAKILYEWLDTTKVSRIRMLLNWQASAGLSFVSSTHNRAAQCFLYYGNTEHGDGMKTEVTLTEFQACIHKRHAAGSSGICGEGPVGVDDYA